MDLIRYAINKPISVAVGVIIILMFGIIGLVSLPIQLTPDVESPKITVNTTWAGATPYEVEQEIIEKQEEKLKGLKNLVLLESSSFNNYGNIELTFEVGTDLSDALLRTSNKMNEVSDYPDNADRPVIEAAGAQSSPVVWLMLKTKAEDSTGIINYQTYFENEVRQHLERVEGVGSLFVGGGTEDELHITIDAAKMARHNISIGEVIEKVRGANRNVSAGTLGMGKKNFRVRTLSKFQKTSDPMDVVIFDDGVKRIFLGDIATYSRGNEKQHVSVIQNNDHVIVVGVRKEQGANVISLVERLKKAVEKLNNGVLAEQNLYFDWVHDDTPYINTAIDIVQKNVMIGGALAIMVLLIFLRSFSATLTTAIAIPISVIGTFIFLWGLGRNLNVVSLAGISFAVGMLVDNSIVVLENIDRHRKLGKGALAASYDGAAEVLGAVIASTVTTIAVFLPVIFIQEEAGQLFRDIAIAITFSIMISLFVSVAVIPTVMHQFYKRSRQRTPGKGPIGWIGEKLAGVIMFFSNLFLKNFFTRIVSVVLFTALSVFLVQSLIPKAEYLPQGNRNLILNILVPPPGYSVEKREEIGDYIFKQTQIHFEKDGVEGIPQIEDIFYVAMDRMNLFGAISVHETRAREMMPLFNRIIRSIPDMFGISIQAGIFQDELGSGRSVDVNISGERLEELIGAARMFYGTIAGKIKGSRIRPIPSLEISYPEAIIVPDKVKLAANGLDETDLGIYVDILMDGRKIDDFQPEGKKKIDLILKGDDRVYSSPEEVLGASIVNRYGQLIRIGDVARMEYSQGMTQVDHYERHRNIRLEVTPPDSVPLQEAMEIIEKTADGMRQKGLLNNISVSVGGNADKLTQTREALQWNFLLALAITYLLMSALFENFFYPLIIMFTVPLAAAGGFIGLALVDRFVAPQGFDVLTMLGFIILVGTVVNNAILIVHQSLNNVRYEGLAGVSAITESVRTRIRPIFMSAATSVFGMFPLVISTGSGSELYRGLGSVLLGGLALSTLFTLFVVPSLLAFFIGFEGKRDEKTV